MRFELQYWNKGSYWYPKGWWSYAIVPGNKVLFNLKKLRKLYRVPARAIPMDENLTGSITLKETTTKRKRGVK